MLAISNNLKSLARLLPELYSTRSNNCYLLLLLILLLLLLLTSVPQLHYSQPAWLSEAKLGTQSDDLLHS